MTYTTAEGRALLTPDEIEDMFVRPVLAQSIAGRACSIIRTNAPVVQLPKMTRDVSATWVDELEEIPISAPSYDSMDIVPKKIAGLVPISSEVDEDTNRDMENLIGERLTSETSRGIDAAFLTAQTGPAPGGLSTITPTVIDGDDKTWMNYDAFTAVAAEAEDSGAPITAWIMSPKTRTHLATAKNNAVPCAAAIVSPDGSRTTYRAVEGGQVITSSHVADGVVWGIPATRAIMIVRRDVRVEVSDHALWSRDGFSIRSTMRVGFGFPDPAAVYRIDGQLPA